MARVYGMRKRFVSSGTKSVTRAKYFYNDVYKVVLPEKHRFPMTKYKSVRELLTEELHGRNDVTFEVSPLATIEEITTTHCPSYVERFFKGDMTAQELRRVGFPWTISGVQRSASSVGGTIAAMRAVCEGNSDCDEPPVPVAAHLAGGTHHAFYDRGEGFCVFSDIAIT